MLARPYFMSNPKWYKEKWVGSDTDGGVEYELTSEAPPKAVESFNEYFDSKHAYSATIQKRWLEREQSGCVS